MHTNLVTETYATIASELDEAAAWLSSIGLHPKSGRLAAYKKQFNQLLEAQRAGTIEQLIKTLGFATIHNSILEAAEWRAIFRTLSSMQVKNVQESLRRFVKGPQSAKDELSRTASNRARDTAFELNIAAHFISAGFPVNFGSDADLEANLEGVPLYVECKRPQSEYQINRRIKDAQKQLVRRYESSGTPEASRGLVAISATKVWNPATKILRVPDEAYLEVALSRFTEAFVREHRRRWQRCDDSRTLGALVQFRCLAYLTLSPRLVSCTQFALSNCLGLAPPDIHALQVLTKRFLDPATTLP